LLTDSGGFQVFSLEGFRRVDDDGVAFQSHVDGSRRSLTPERATEIQWVLGADIAMAFDHVVSGGADAATARDAMERTLRWLERCGKRHEELKAAYDATTSRRTGNAGAPERRGVAQRPERLGLHARRPSEHPQCRAPRRSAAARRDVRLRDLHHVLARLSPPLVHGRGAAGAPAPVVAQRSLLDPARRSDAGRDPAERLRPLGRGVAPPLPALGIRMTAHGLFALLFAPSGQNVGGGLPIFL